MLVLFLGTVSNIKGYKCLFNDGRLYLSWDVIFYENVFHSSPSSSTSSPIVSIPISSSLSSLVFESYVLISPILDSSVIPNLDHDPIPINYDSIISFGSLCQPLLLCH